MKDNTKESPAIVSPHDKLFKAVMAHIEVAKDFIKNNYPASLLKQIDLETLTLENGSYIDDELVQSETDILYKVNLLEKEESAYLYLLVEHQSTSDKWLPFRLVKYMCRIADQEKKQNPRQEYLPIIFPLIFYNGKGRYADSTYLFDLFGKFKEMAKEIFSKPFQLVDLNDIPDETLRAHQWSGVMELALKYARREYTQAIKLAWVEFINKIMKKMERKTATDILIILLNYTLDQDSQGKGRLLQDWIRECAKTNSEVEKVMQTLKEKLQSEAKWEGIQQGIQKGRQQGVEQGIEQGMEQGIYRGESNIIKKLYSNLRDINKVAALSGVSIEEVKRIIVDEN